MSPPQISVNDSSSSSSFYATSAPTSPNRSFFQQDTANMCFYSVPNSPTRGMILDPDCNFGTKISSPSSTKIAETEDVNFNLDGFQRTNFDFDDFEFETSRHFNISVREDDDDDNSINSDDSENLDFKLELDNLRQQTRKRPRQRHERHESLPAMAFADELFCDGKVMPLNPPPCQQYSNSIDNKIGKDFSSPNLSPSPSPSRSPRSTSPINPSSIFKLPFPRRNLWNDDFDPFMVALENVKEGKKHRRAWSMLTLRTCTQWDPKEFMDDKYLYSGPIIVSSNRKMEPNSSPTIIPQQSMKDCSKSPIRLAEPKGVVFARRARMVKMDYKGPSRPNIIPIEPTVQGGENEGLGARPSTNGSKWQKIMSFAVRSSFINKTSSNNQQKQRVQTVEFSKPKILKKLSFRSNKLVQSQCNEEERQASQMTKMTLVRYRPKLLLCMGYGTKYAK